MKKILFFTLIVFLVLTLPTNAGWEGSWTDGIVTYFYVWVPTPKARNPNSGFWSLTRVEPYYYGQRLGVWWSPS
jgi:hypothetical protein